MEDATTDLRGKDLAHGVMQHLTSVLVDIQIVNNFHSIAPELSVENPVCDLDGDQDSHDVEGFPEGIFQVVKVVFLVITSKICSYLCIFDNFEPFPPNTSTSFVFLLSALPTSSSSVILVVVPSTSTSTSTFLPFIVAAIPSSVIPGSNEQFRPGVFSSDDVTEQIGLEEFLPENVRQFGDDEEQTQHVRQPEVVVGHRGVSCGLQSSLVNVAASRYT